MNDRDAKADKGTDMHALLEEYVKNCIDNNQGKPLVVTHELKQIQMFIDWSIINVNKFMFSERNVYSSRLWTGGIFDLMFEDKGGRICIGDFKSSKEAYLSQFIQIAGYDIQQWENGIFNDDGYKLSEGYKIEAYYVFPFGSEKFEVGVRLNTEILKDGFENCVNLYKLTNE
jgi:hypothetical protein